MNDFTFYAYLFNIFTCVMTGILLLVSKITPGLNDPHYRNARILISTAILLLAAGKGLTLLRSTDILLDIFPFIPLVLASFQACLITFTVLILFHSDYVSRHNIFISLMPTFVFVVLYVIVRLFVPEIRIHNWQEYGCNITNPVVLLRSAFLVTYLVVIVRYIRLFNRERNIYIGRINDYFSDTDKIRSVWGTRLFYEGLAIGLSFAVVCSWPSAVIDGISTVIMTIFYFSFAIRYINYQYKLLILQPAVGVNVPVVETAPAKVPVDVSAYTLEYRLQQLIAQKQPYLTPGVVIADLAGQLNVSSRELSYLIHQTYDMNFNTWINTLRIDYALELMKQNPHIAFDELAEQSGFSDKTKFSRVFKQTTGFLYKDYKNQH